MKLYEHMATSVVIKNKLKFQFSKIFLHAVLILFCLFCLVPLLLVISISFSDEAVLLKDGYRLLPEKFSFLAYTYIFKNLDQIINSYFVTIIVTITGSVSGLIIASMLAYTTTRKDYKYRNVTSFIVFFTFTIVIHLCESYISKYINTMVIEYIDYSI